MRSQTIEFFVPGIPAPGGSKKAFYNRRTGRAMIVDDAGQRNKDWRSSVQVFFKQVYSGEPMACPLHLRIEFVMPRPKGHFRAGKRAHELREDCPCFHTTRPDATKLTRSTEDALTGLAWRDDAQVVIQTIRKVYGTTPGAWVRISPVTTGEDRTSE